MKKTLVALMAAVVMFGASMHDAEAARFGGGRTSGMSRSPAVMNRQAVSPTPAPSVAPAPATVGAAAAAPARSGMSRWLGPLAGLAAGIGLAALFSHFGMGEGFSSIIMMLLLAAGVVIVIRLLFRKKAEAEPLPYAANNAPGAFRYAEPAIGGGAAPAANTNYAPSDFDVEGFLRQAKLNFIRLQAANDKGDMDDIRTFTSPELFAEVQMQYQERGRAAQQTDVIQLNADLLDVSIEDKRYVASVRFHGQIRETVGAAPEAFNEVWHLLKPADGSGGWIVAGIQQAQ